VYVVIKDVVQQYEDRHVREDRYYMVEISTTTDEFVAKRKIAIIGIYIYIYIYTGIYSFDDMQTHE